MNAIGSIPPSTSVYQEEMKDINKSVIGHIEDDLKQDNESVQNAGNPDYDPNDVDPSDESTQQV